ncbi:hypothetical protein FEM48_Zijuj08G0204400 [Ziziphus jujuba var. spinosa]|nr:hypothetical protein FEM48_Zijuj08G0204400 [Ziziphus jujuba var. spinosa]
MNQFYSLIKDSLVADVSSEQFTDKIKRLKRKFMQNKKNKLADPNLSIDYDSHSKRVFELSKQMWDQCVWEPESEEKRKTKEMVNNKIDDSADDDDKKKIVKKKKKRKITTESVNVYHKAFHKYCEDRGLEVKWLEKEERDKLDNLWRQFSELECDLRILEIKYNRLRNDLDVTIYRLLIRCYNNFPALFSFDY